MHVLRTAISVAGLFLTIPPLSAQPGPQRDPNALAILARSYAVVGPSAASVQDTVAHGIARCNAGLQESWIIKTKEPDLVRNEFSTSSGQVVSVFGAGRGRQTREGVGRQLPAWVSKYERPYHIPALSRLRDFKNPTINITYLGVTDIEGQSTHQIRVSAMPSHNVPAEIEALISEFHLFIDTNSFLVLKTRGFLFSPDLIENRSPLETFFGDYRAIAGLLVPHRITRYVAGQKECELVVTSVRVNVGLLDSDFQ